MRKIWTGLLVLALLLGCTGWDPVGPEAGIRVDRALPPSILRAKPGADVLIDAGHGGIDGGTHYGEIMEKDINLAIARKLYLLLRSRGVRAVLNRTGDYALSDDNRWHVSRSRHRRDLSQRGSLPDEIEASLLVSIHVNWAPRGRKSGPLVLYREGDGRAALLAHLVQDSMLLQQGRVRGLPKTENRIYLLNRARSVSVLVETGFLSDAGDRAMLTSLRGQTRVAEAIARGIMAYRTVGLGADEKAAPAPTASRTSRGLAARGSRAGARPT